MIAVFTLSEDRDLHPVALASNDREAERLAARHILDASPPGWSDLETAYAAGVYDQVVALWNANRHQTPGALEYLFVDLGEALDAFVARAEAV